MPHYTNDPTYILNYMHYNRNSSLYSTRNSNNLINISNIMNYMNQLLSENYSNIYELPRENNVNSIQVSITYSDRNDNINNILNNSLNETQNINNGLSKEKIEEISTIIKNNNITKIFCSICQDNCKENIDIRQLKCNHKYCKECIDKWFNINNTCPSCKIEF